MSSGTSWRGLTRGFATASQRRRTRNLVSGRIRMDSSKHRRTQRKLQTSQIARTLLARISPTYHGWLRSTRLRDDQACCWRRSHLERIDPHKQLRTENRQRLAKRRAFFHYHFSKDCNQRRILAWISVTIYGCHTRYHSRIVNCSWIS